MNSINWETTNLDCAEILAACISCVPVNARLDQAIVAHRTAFKAFERDRDNPHARQLVLYALRAVILARLPDIAAYRAQLDYLTASLKTHGQKRSNILHKNAETRRSRARGVQSGGRWRAKGSSL